MAGTIVQPSIRQQKIDLARGRQTQRRHEINLAAIAKGKQPNRTPGKALLRRLGLGGTGGSAQGDGSNAARLNKALGQNAPPKRKKRLGS